ncbi:MAG: acetate kinase [Verrucomicrobia bacterium]|nr:MAG: acetate kinase [Verrucomicrobiota bacterium]
MQKELSVQQPPHQPFLETAATEGTPKVLVLNSGSSSLKFAVVEPSCGRLLFSGIVDRLGTQESELQIKLPAACKKTIPTPFADHHKSLDTIFPYLKDFGIIGVGHRVVHGGEKFHESVVIDDAAQSAIADCAVIAPLHAPANLTTIQVARKKFPNLPQVAVFDTAFHQTLPPYAYRYAVPQQWYEQYGIRKYGFHGTSHCYVSQEASRLLGIGIEDLQLLTAHLGNGASVCAIRNGKSVDTSMGLTPLEGLIMGTRSGDIDANVLLFLHQQTGLSLAEITDVLNKKSGLLGLSGVGNDMRVLLEEKAKGHCGAALAVEAFCYRLARHLLAAAAGLDRIDALIFTGGIGENSPPIRERALEHLRILGTAIDPKLNGEHGESSAGRITSSDSKVLAMVIHTNEELLIARETVRLIRSF